MAVDVLVPVTKDTPSESAPKQLRKKKHTTPGTLYQLSEACRQAARVVTRQRQFLTVYDSINLTFRVAEQILGRKSTYALLREAGSNTTTDAVENRTCAT